MNRAFRSAHTDPRFRLLTVVVVLLTFAPVGVIASPGASAFASPNASASVSGDADYLPSLRALFYRAVKSESAVSEVETYLGRRFPSPFGSWPPTAQAYYGALEGLRAKYAQGLLDKLGYVQKALSILRDLPDKNPGNLEILALRYSLFRELPFFFGVSSTVHPDFERILTTLEENRSTDLPIEIRRAIETLLIESGEASPSEVTRLKALRARDASSP